MENELTPSNNDLAPDGVAPSVPRPPEPSKKETALVAWLAFMILGGGLLALYYARIGYLPDIEWRLTLVYVAVVSFIGGAYGLLQSLAIFLPGYIWCEAIIGDSHIREELCHVEPDKHAPNVLRHEPSISWVFRYIGSPFLFCLVVSHIILPLAVPISFPWGPLLYVSVTIITLAISSRYVWNRFPCLLHEVEERKSRLWKYIFWFDLSVLLSQIATLLLYYISIPLTTLSYIAISVVCICVVSITNHVVAVRFWENPRQAIGASIVASLLLLVAANYFTNLPEKIMGLYGLGENHKVDITLVSADGADAVGKLGLKSSGCPPPVSNKLCGVEILSAIGSEYLIKLDDDNKDNKAYTVFTVPKSMVVSRAESRSNAEPPRPCERK
jgi:heme/copper-type cytochrome/quinol oxidase subunit 4